MSYLKNIQTIKAAKVAAELKDVISDFIQALAADEINRDSRVKVIETSVRSIINLIFPDGVSEQAVPKLVKAYSLISNILTIQTELVESNGKAQFAVKSSLGHLLIKTLDNDYHSLVEPCKSYDSAKGVCKFGNPFLPGTKDLHKFVCDFHLHDSLSTHLILASIHNGVWVIEHGHDDRTVMLATFVGLMHDIGKVIAVETYEFKKTTITGFPGHAEVGAMQFQMHFSPEMEKLISKQDFMLVRTAILKHMCGYHGDKGESTDYRRGLLKMEPADVLAYLTYNRIGDHFGKLVDATDEKDAETVEHFLDEQKLFEQQMTDKSSNFDLVKLLAASSNKSGEIIPKIALFLIGTSGAGKSFLLAELTRRFPGMIEYVSRDEMMGEVCTGVRKRYEGVEYIAMHNIYKAGKALSALLRKKAAGKFGKQDGAVLARARTELAKAQIAWNVLAQTNGLSAVKVHETASEEIPDIMSQVNDLFIALISQSVQGPKPIVIIDTFMSCFPMAIENNVPSSLSKCFRVHIHVQSYLERKTTSIAETIEEQLAISGPYGIYNPIHPDGFGDGKGKKAFASLSSEIGSTGCLPNSTFTSRFRPHLVVGICTRTKAGNLGYDELYDSLERLISCFKSAAKKDEDIDVKSESTSADAGSDSEAIVDSNETFGVDPATKDMDLVTFYEYLLKKYSGDRSKIRDFLRTLDGENPGQCGFMHNSFLEVSYDSYEPDAQAEYRSDLSALSKIWHSFGVVKTPHDSADFLDADLRERYANSIVILKYFEQYGARFWQNVWAKEMRGTVLFIHPETLEVTVLSFKLPRGAEAVTGMVKEKGLETQDVKPGKIKILDEEQKDTCTRLATNKPIEMILSSKGDGSLLVLNVFSGRAKVIMEGVDMIFGNEYSAVWRKHSIACSGGKYLVLPASQGTVIEGGFMAPYMVTSLLIGSYLTDRATLQKMHEAKKSYTDVFEMYADRFFERLFKMKFFDALSGSHTLSFEAICKDRVDAFGGHPHIELACSYDRDRLIFLGISITEKRFYIPHALYSTLSPIPFEEPLWWKIEHAAKVDKMLEDIGLLILKKITKGDFLRSHPPNNAGFDALNEKMIDDAIIDFEGWVAMKFAAFETTDSAHTEVEKCLKIVRTIYSKIKTEPYYRSHKYREENIPYLMELSKTASEIFPLARKIAGIFGSNAFANRFKVIGVDVMGLLNFSEKDNTILPKLKEVFAKTLADAEALVAVGKLSKVPKDPLNGFEKRPFAVQCKMALNFPGFDFGELLVPIYLRQFPEIDPFHPEIKRMFAGLTMNLQPWEKGYDERVKELNPYSPVVQELVTACLGSSVC